MANGCLQQKVSREEFMRKTNDDKLVCLFDVVSTVQGELERMKRRPIIDKLYSFVGGIVGGAAAMLGKEIMK